jgi:hypothetical protein
MADELEPVQQAFIADMSDYIEPIDDAAAKTEGFADVVEQAGEGLGSLRDKAAETGGALDEMAASADDDAASTETLAETVARFRDEIYEANPGIDDATASLLAMAAAADADNVSMEALDHSLSQSNFEASGLQQTLTTLRSELGALAEGETVAITRSGMNEYIVAGTQDLEEEARALGRTRQEAEVTGDQIRTTGLEASEAFTGGASAIDDYRAKLHALAVDLEDLDTVSAGVARDLEGIVGAGEGGGGGGGLLRILNFFAGGGEGGEASVGALLGNVGALAAGLLVVAPAIAGVVVELGGLVGAGLAAGAGIGALAALAVPSLEKIASSYTGISQAQAAYRAAVQLERTDPSKDNLEAEATAAAKLKIAWEDVPPAVRPALRSLDELKTEYGQMVKAFEPDAFKIFNDGLKVADDLLPALEPLAKGAAGAVEGLLGQLDKAIRIVPGGVERLGHLFGGVSPGSGSGGFQEFITYLSKISPAVITTIGTDLGKLAGDFAKIMESFSKQDYINAVNIAFEALSFTLGGLTRMAHNAMNFWDEISAGAKSARNWFDETRHAVAVFGRDFNDVTKQMGTDEANWANDTRRDFDDARHAVAGAWDGIRHDISSATDAINTDVSRFGSRVESDIVSAGHQIEAAWDRSWSAVVSYTRSIPGRILGALGNIGGLLVSAGERLIEGMISGIRDEAGSLVSAAEGVVGDAVSAAEHLLHIGSPSRVTWEHGRMMDQGWANGIIDNAHLVKSAVTSVLGGLPLGIAGGASAAPVHITVPVTLTGGAALASPQQLQQLQQVVQEAILRYTQLNQGSGLFLPGRRS